MRIVFQLQKQITFVALAKYKIH